MFNKTSQMDLDSSPVLSKSPSNIDKHDQIFWLEETKTVQIFIAYNESKPPEEIAVCMAVLINRVAEYGPWALSIEMLIQPRVIRLWESPNIYTQHVREMRSLISRINETFEHLHHVSVQVDLDYVNFQQMKLMACLFALNVQWTLTYHVEDTCHIRIGAESHLMKRLRSVYDQEFDI